MSVASGKMHSLFTCVVQLLSLVTLVSSRVVPPYATTSINDTSFPLLLEATLDDLASGLESNLFTSADLVRAYSARILEVNSTLHVVHEINPDAIAIATHADELRKNGTILGPLHGIPILIKDNIATDDGMNNTAGSFALLGARQGESTVAAKLRKAGAVILGKTNLSQWANFRSNNSTNGWSAYGGQTEGVYYPEQDPSGSSSGSGVASAIGLALGSLGTETSGSILSPADVSNLVGIKPSVGLTSRHLVIPISEHQDTVGPMTRTVKDAAYILQAIAGPDTNDNYTSAIPNNGSIPDYISACTTDALQGVRIGVARNVLDIWGSFIDAPVLEAFQQAVSEIEAAGATMVDANFTGFEAYQSDGNGTLVLNADFLVNLKSYFSELTYNPYNISNLEQLKDFTQSFPAEAYPDRDTGAWDGPDGALTQGWDNTDPRFWEAYQANLYFGAEGGILGALERSNTTAVLLPTQLSPGIPAIVGSPVITVPMGFYPANWTVTRNRRGSLVTGGPSIPFGLSFMGDMWSERDLIGYAYAYEQQSKHRGDVLPYLVPNIELADVL